MLSVAGGGGLAAYPVTALLTRRLEALRQDAERAGMPLTAYLIEMAALEAEREIEKATASAPSG